MVSQANKSMRIWQFIRRTRLAGHDVYVREANKRFRLAKRAIFAATNPDLALDCGANEGQWASEFRYLFEGIPIVSFEPVKEAAEKCIGQEIGSHSVINVALSDYAGSGEMYVAPSQTVVSSLLKPDSNSDLDSGAFLTQTVEVKRLDDFPFMHQALWLKLDLQGGEFKALKGAKDTLKKVVVLEIECAVSPLYEGESLISDVLSLLSANGFQTVAILSVPGKDGLADYLDILACPDEVRTLLRPMR